MKRTGLLERDAITFPFYVKIMKSKRKPKECFLLHSRFRVAVTLLFFTGARVNEIRNFTKKDFDALLKTHEIFFHQTKTNRQRSVPIGMKALEHFKAIEHDVIVVFEKQATLGGNFTSLQWIKFINTRLKNHTKTLKMNEKPRLVLLQNYCQNTQLIL